MSFLIDTCVLSEMMRPSPDADAAAWLITTPVESKFVSVITLSEIRFGILSADDGRKKSNLVEWYEQELRPSFAERVLSFDEDVALQWARLRSEHRNPPMLDSQIAATALFHGLTLVTRNVKDFAFKGLSVFNPWRK